MNPTVKQTLRKLVGGAIVGLLLASSSLLATTGMSRADQPTATAYTLSVGDQVNVNVLGHSEFTMTATILPDGTFNYPTIGTVRAVGKTADQITDLLSKSLVSSGQLNNPNITVTVTQGSIHRISVVGQVKNPGLYDTKQGWKVLDAIAASGGLAQAPSLSDGMLIKAGGGTGTPINFAALLDTGDLSKNLPVGEGDIVIVQAKDPSTTMIQVTGEVAHPGQYVVPGEGTSVLTALTQAGGVTDAAALSRIQVLHGSDTKVVNLRGVMDSASPADDKVRVMAGDTVIVPTNKSRIAVWGEVAKPSVYVIPDGESLAIPGALSLAGGLTDAAEKGSVVLVRAGADGKAVQTVVDMKQYLAGTSTVQMALQPGDVVYVPTKKQSPSTIQILPALGGLASILRLVL